MIQIDLTSAHPGSRVYCIQAHGCFSFNFLGDRRITNRVGRLETYNHVGSRGQRIGLLAIQVPHSRAAMERTLKDLLLASDHVVAVCPEMFDDTVEFMNAHDDRRITYFTSGVFDSQHKKSQVYVAPTWPETVARHYRDQLPPDLLTKLAPYTPKANLYECLLGTSKPHRDFVYEYINDSPTLKDRGTVTYWQGGNIQQSGIWEPGIEFISGCPNHSVEPVLYYGHKMTASCIVPIEVYNQCAYSIVAETNPSSEYSFFTEKIGKPMMGKRLFVVIAGRHYLKNLRRLGYQTFDDIIDENYDDIVDDHERWTAALHQIEILATKDQQQVLDSIQPRAEFNYAKLMATEGHVQVEKLIEDLLKVK
jgi:hypothetical protein